MPELNFFTYGPADGPEILAIHGMTGHGARWADLADNYLAEARVIAPDLIGHGRSPWTPPWDIVTQVESLAALLTSQARGPVLVLGHSFGGALAIHLALRHPELVRALVLLDPAIDLDAADLLEVAGLTAKYPDYTDADEAKSEKINGAWADVPIELLEQEVTDHLIPADNGRVTWRISTPAVVSSWGELARPLAVPPAGTPTVLVQAMRVQPPYVGDELKSALKERLGADLSIVELDCDHMVAQAKPTEVAELVRRLL
ncbi:alpha/beta hydrolase [Rhodococcus sp. G-MC3]|uniref:alpha/beta fold hydrolase n=1 Tax=Rhodococcus sp. G-MC3 TaxID=3046209 RepID=UPI0024BB2C9F|nr:alpha/beta hydrolase [Rhodococcus sp. G-MC3]MDJ0395221.1 alpha/beta hydrolase [Rhodococcus sp. G-MC3]